MLENAFTSVAPLANVPLAAAMPTNLVNSLVDSETCFFLPSGVSLSHHDIQTKRFGVEEKVIDLVI